MIKSSCRYLLALFFVGAGLNHFLNPEFYLNIMPPYLPLHRELVVLSGIAEIALGLAVLVPRWTRYAAWGLIALLIAVFPANIHMAMNPASYPDLPVIGLWLRLPVQGLFIAWAYWISTSFKRP